MCAVGNCRLNQIMELLCCLNRLKVNIDCRQSAKKKLSERELRPTVKFRLKYRKVFWRKRKTCWGFVLCCWSWARERGRIPKFHHHSRWALAVMLECFRFFLLRWMLEKKSHSRSPLKQAMRVDERNTETKRQCEYRQICKHHWQCRSVWVKVLHMCDVINHE